ncbi:response regulator transcription factor [Halomonas daqiaonensis]|uniref:Response regulator receiver domain-containing protein n=1 Tax=Halomonas daqiaonensis TaxID=650850 RepID=A0A1H7L537_9GAMM|nr:response regulator [Halomonas daqiaonensis]SEK94078.1 Response regulator receiver domain-containing protein [Halomonas daqiaonensis]
MRAKILICDDEPHIRRLIQQSLEELEDEGVTLFSAGDGEEALAVIRDQRPDMVILDIMMPGRNGFDVCAEVKADASLRSAYVVLLTAKGQEYDRQHGDRVGADCYMTKPFDPDELLAMSRRVIEPRTT